MGCSSSRARVKIARKQSLGAPRATQILTRITNYHLWCSRWSGSSGANIGWVDISRKSLIIWFSNLVPYINFFAQLTSTSEWEDLENLGLMRDRTEVGGRSSRSMQTNKKKEKDKEGRKETELPYFLIFVWLPSRLWSRQTANAFLAKRKITLYRLLCPNRTRLASDDTIWQHWQAREGETNETSST